ncbi:MAG: TetR/AcrR family transcriptional regulator [Bacteroidota bacterium]
MRPQKVDDGEMLERLFAVLRSKGYEGASLNDLSKASGLQKASLYHRFPGGKKEIGEAVLAYSEQWVRENIHNKLKDSSITPEKRVVAAIAKIEELYDLGKNTCILRAMSMDAGIQLFLAPIKRMMQEWIDTLSVLGNDMGMDRNTAHKKAIQTLTLIEGALVVSKGIGTTEAFEMAMQSIKDMYMVDQ